MGGVVGDWTSFHRIQRSDGSALPRGDLHLPPGIEIVCNPILDRGQPELREAVNVGAQNRCIAFGCR